MATFSTRFQNLIKDTNARAVFRTSYTLSRLLRNVDATIVVGDPGINSHAVKTKTGYQVQINPEALQQYINTGSFSALGVELAHELRHVILEMRSRDARSVTLNDYSPSRARVPGTQY